MDADARRPDGHGRAIAILLLLLAALVVMPWTYSRYLGPSPTVYVAWDVLHVGLGLIVLPVWAAALVFRRLGPSRRGPWAGMDFAICVVGTAVMAYAVDGFSYWAQETRLPLSRGTTSILWDLSRAAGPLTAAAGLVCAWQLVRRIRAFRR